MSYLIRMIGQNKEWVQTAKQINNLGSISADAISDLHSTDNCISTWDVNNKNKDDVKKGIQALTSGFRALEDIKIVYLDFDKLITSGFNIIQTNGLTKIKNYEKLHRDISDLNSDKLQNLAKIILEEVWSKNTEIIHKQDIIYYLIEALNDGLLEFNSLEKNVKQELASNINKQLKKGKLKESDFDKKVLDDIKEQIKKQNKKTNCRYEEFCERYNKK